MPMLALSDRDTARIVEALRALAAAKANPDQESGSPDVLEARDLGSLAGDIERSAAVQRLPPAHRPPCRCDQAPGMCVLHGVVGWQA